MAQLAVERLYRRLLKAWTDAQAAPDSIGYRWENGAPTDIEDEIDYEPDGDKRPQWLKDMDESND